MQTANKDLPIDNKEEEFDIKQGLYIIKKYKISIMIIMIIFILGSSLMAYFKPSMYFSSAILEVSSQNKSKSNDPILQALGYGEDGSRGTESILRSKYLILKTLENLELRTRYYTIKKFKEIELYKKSPFVVTVSFMEYNLLNKKIKIIPIDDETFELSYKTTTDYSINGLINYILDVPKTEINYKGIHRFGEATSTQHFKLKVNKVRDFTQQDYYFSYVENRDMIGFIQQGLSTSPSAKYASNIFIRFDDTVALRAKDIVDGLIDTHIKDAMEQKQIASRMSLNFIDKQLKRINDSLTKSEKVLQGFKQDNNLVDLRTKASIVSDDVKETQMELDTLASEESILENLKEYMDENEDLTGLTVQPLRMTVENLNELITRYRNTIIQRKAILVEVTEVHPEVIKLNEEVIDLRKNIQATVVLSLKAIKTRKEYLRKMLEKRKLSLTKIPEQERELGALTRNSSVNQKLYSFLLQVRVETAILQSSTISNIRVMDSASLPRAPYAPNKIRAILFGGLFGLMIGIIISFIRAFVNNVINNIDEVERLSQYPIYGKIPYNKSNTHSIVYEEAFRALRTNLEFMQANSLSKTVLVASSVSGEGKSTTIKNMANMLIKLNKKVIVLDFDLRRPSLHKYFKDLNNDIGLSMFLSGQNSLSESIQRTSDNIDVIVAGPIPPNPSELIMSKGTDLLLQTLSKTYDYILIDTPPYSVVTDATILMKKSDIVLFSLMVNYSKKKAIKQLNEIILNYGINSAGIVLNGLVLAKKEKHGYGYYDN